MEEEEQLSEHAKILLNIVRETGKSGISMSLPLIEILIKQLGISDDELDILNRIVMIEVLEMMQKIQKQNRQQHNARFN